MCIGPILIFNPKNSHAKRENDKIQVPCGQCIECRLTRSRHWSLRLEHENYAHKTSCFLTLTLSDENLVWGYQVPTLYPKHVQLFWKRLRKALKIRISHYTVGEYGDKNGRPHYHAILFGYNFPDKTLYKRVNGYNLYTSKRLDKIWGLGQCIIGEVTFESIAYVTRYALKKCTGNTKGVYKALGIEPEFSHMSRNPAIGKRWYEKYSSDLYPHDRATTLHGVKLSVPRYYNNKFRKTNPEQYEEILNRRLDNVQPGHNSTKQQEARRVGLESRYLQFKRDIDAHH